MFRTITSAAGVALAALALTVPAAVGDPREKEMTVQGTLKHPVFAIGGETTGTVVTTAKDGTFELDLGGKKKLAELAESLNGKTVEVTGTLRIVKGVEVPERRIITVSKLKAVK